MEIASHLLVGLGTRPLLNICGDMVNCICNQPHFTYYYYILGV